VRTPAEFADGHIPGAVNVPLQQIGSIAAAVPEAATPLFVYCLSGGRSAQAAAALKRAGYGDVRNIGGIGSWNGEVER
jgi:rhodanese-related sulfurtransferase